MRDVSLDITGMSCSHCVAAVEAALQAVPGVAGATVGIGSAQVAIDPSGGAPDAITAEAIEAIRDAGYDAALVGDR